MIRHFKYYDTQLLLDAKVWFPALETLTIIYNGAPPSTLGEIHDTAYEVYDAEDLLFDPDGFEAVSKSEDAFTRMVEAVFVDTDWRRYYSMWEDKKGGRDVGGYKLMIEMEARVWGEGVQGREWNRGMVSHSE